MNDLREDTDKLFCSRGEDIEVVPKPSAGASKAKTPPASNLAPSREIPDH